MGGCSPAGAWAGSACGEQLSTGTVSIAPFDRSIRSTMDRSIDRSMDRIQSIILSFEADRSFDRHKPIDRSIDRSIDGLSIAHPINRNRLIDGYNLQTIERSSNLKSISIGPIEPSTNSTDWSVDSPNDRSIAYLSGRSSEQPDCIDRCRSIESINRSFDQSNAISWWIGWSIGRWLDQIHRSSDRDPPTVLSFYFSLPAMALDALDSVTDIHLIKEKHVRAPAKCS